MPMATSLLSSSLKLPVEVRKSDRLFFDQYRYCLNFKLQELTVLRCSDHNRIDHCLNIRTEYGVNRSFNWGGSWRGSLREITPEVRANCHEFYDFIKSTTVQHKLTIYGDWGYCYSNDINFLKSIADIFYIQPVKYSECVVSRERGTVSVKNSKFDQRTYFKNIRLSEKEREYFTNFLNNQGKTIRLSPALDEWVKNSRYHFLNDYYFIDHTGESVLNMLSLVLPGSVRKTLKITKGK